MIRSYARYTSPGLSRGLRKTLASLAQVVLLTFLMYLLIGHFLVSSYRVQSSSMLPTLREGDRILMTPLSYGPKVPFVASWLPGFSQPRRGDLVVLVPPYASTAHPVLAFFDPVFRFFTLQRNSLSEGGGGSSTVRARNPCLVKRIIGLPGDTVRLEGYRAFIRAPGETTFRPEQEAIPVGYRPAIRGLLDGWKPEFPLSGNLEEATLGEGEYFVLGDNRMDSSDSRSWGAVRRSAVLGRVFLRFWPLMESEGF